ncbi:hypothetical protein [Rhizobium ecuadorense]|uniref:hypothetical protein n=1 Tax=Rhizobium ecuadorense TaxID=1671795 RepID=UPI000673222B|nr:hypothetical protein [Rhizobium ecuadorense]
MAEIVQLNMPITLVGVWRSDEDDARSEYHIRVRDGQLLVSARDYIDGERYVVSNVSHDPQRVEFDTFMASTSRTGHVILTATGSHDRAEIRFTFTDVGFMVRHQGE